MSRDPQLKLGDTGEQRTSTLRDIDLERRFLLDASHGREEFVTDVVERLAAGAVEYHDSWQWCGLATLLREAREEGTDLAGWSLLAMQAADLDQRLSDAELEQLTAILTVVGRHAAVVHETLSRALQIIEATRS
jgi:hypothetical protein